MVLLVMIFSLALLLRWRLVRSKEAGIYSLSRTCRYQLGCWLRLPGCIYFFKECYNLTNPVISLHGTLTGWLSFSAPYPLIRRQVELMMLQVKAMGG